MGKAARTARTPKKTSTQLVSSNSGPDFLPLAGGPGRKLPKQSPKQNTSTVLYIGRIPHGFYEEQMQGFFEQFGTIKRLKISRNKKTGKSKHYGFIEFEVPEVAEIVANSMQQHLLFNHLLQVYLLPSDHVHPKLWKGVNRNHTPVDFVQIEKKRHNKDRTGEEHKKLIERIVKRDRKRRRNIEAAGIDYECPEIVRTLVFMMVGADMPFPKKIKFDDE